MYMCVYSNLQAVVNGGQLPPAGKPPERGDDPIAEQVDPVAQSEGPAVR